MASLLTAAVLALGIGTLVTLSGALREVLLSAPPGIEQPENVVRVLRVATRDGATSYADGANYPVLMAMRRLPSIAAIAGYVTRTMSMGAGADATPVKAALVSANYFQLLGARPLRGRTFAAEDGFPEGGVTGGPAVAVLSHSFWQRSFGSDSSIVGKQLRIGDASYAVAAIMPRGFRGTETDAPDLWLPLTVAARDDEVRISLTDRLGYSLIMYARLRDPGDKAAAERAMTVAWNGVGGGVSRETQRVVLAPLVRARGPDAPQEIRVAEWLAFASLLVLIVTCGNAANILLGRALYRRGELELRVILGASRASIGQQLVIDALLFASAGLIGAVLIAAAAGPIVLREVSGVELTGSFIDWRMLLYASGIALVTGGLVGLAPLWVMRHVDHGAFRSTSGLATQPAVRLQHGLLLVQSALCMTMLMAATLFGLSLKRALSLDLGVDARHTLRAVVKLDGLGLSRESADALYSDLFARLSAIPGVEAVALAGTDPYQGGRAVAPFTTDHDADYFWPAGSAQVPMEAAVGAGFFSAVGARSLRGRDFAKSDDRTAARVAIINEPLARKLFGSDDPIGKCMYVQSGGRDPEGCIRIVGLLGGVWYFTMTDRSRPMVYVPLEQRTGFAGYSRPQGWFIRTKGRPGALVNEVRRTIQSTRADMPPARVTPLQEAVDVETRPWRVGAMLFGMFATAAAIVALLGLYSVVAFAAVRQTRGVAIRLALGARLADVLRAVAAPAVVAIGSGLVVGAAGGLAIGFRLAPLLFQTTPTDPRVLVYPLAVMLVISIFAVTGPPLRAWRMPVGQVLRNS